MLSLFRGTSAFQLGLLITLFVVLRLFLIWVKVPLLVPELSWMLVGEQMGRGFTLYVDIWDNTSPLSALVYWLIDSFYSRSQLVYQLIALCLSLFQVVYFNSIIIRYAVFPRVSNIAGLVYALLVSISFDMLTLSPMLMASTFLLLAFGNLVKTLSRRQVGNDVFEMGLYIGIAALFYMPVVVFVIWASLSLIFYTGASIRHHLLGVFGSLFPMLLVVLAYYLMDGLDDMENNLFSAVLSMREINWNKLSVLAGALSVPLLLGGAGLLRVLRYPRFVHFQTQVQQVMAIWFLVGLLTLPFMSFVAPMQFLLFVPPVAFFATFFFGSFRKWYAAELLFLGATAWILLLLFNGVLFILPGFNLGKLSYMEARPALLPSEIQNRKVLVLGRDEGEYLNNFSATPYLNWDLARHDLTSLNSFENVIHISDNFLKDSPDYIVDKEHIMPKIFVRIPVLKRKYRASRWESIYERVD